MARLFTVNDVERAARLAAQYAQFASDHEVEPCVAHALATITEEAPLFYSESEVRSMLQYTLGKEAVDAELADALQAIGR